MKTTNLIFGGLIVWAGYELWKNHSLKSALSAMKSDVNNLKNSVIKLKNSSTEMAANTTQQPTVIANGNIVEPTTPIMKGDSAFSNLFGRTVYNEVINPICGLQVKNYKIGCSTDRLRNRANLNQVFRSDGWSNSWR